VAEAQQHPNAALVRTFFDALVAGETERALGCYAEDGVYRVSGNNLVSGNYRGRAAILSHHIKLRELTGGTMRLTMDDLIAEQGHAVLFWHVTAERAGSAKRLDANGIMAFKVDDQGSFSESWFLYNDRRAYDDFFS
jgi:ketosteroid isomerase-like protein